MSKDNVDLFIETLNSCLYPVTLWHSYHYKWDYTNAVKMYSQAKNKENQDIVFYICYPESLQKIWKHLEAIEILTTWIIQNPDKIYLYHSRWNSHFSLMNNRMCITDLEKVAGQIEPIRENSHFYSTRLYLWISYSNIWDKKKALENLRIAVNCVPSFKEILKEEWICNQIKDTEEFKQLVYS